MRLANRKSLRPARKASHVRHVVAVKRCDAINRHDLVRAKQEALKTTDGARHVVRPLAKISETMSQLYENRALERISSLVQVLVDDRAALDI